jgi:hypothetical protein
MVGVRNDLLQLSAKFDFEGTEPQGTPILSIVRQLPAISSLQRFPQRESSVLSELHKNKRSVCNTALHTYYTQQIKWTMTNIAQSTVRATIRLAMCVSRSLCYTFRAVSAISGHELQEVFNNMFTRCQEAYLES